MRGACASCVGRCSVEVKASYARLALKALVADQGYPECLEWQDKYWLDAGGMKGEYRRLFRRDQAVSVTASPFDVDRAYRMAERVYAQIDAFFPVGALAWARVAAPDLFARQGEAARAVDAAFEGENLELVKVSLGDFGRAMRAISVRFEEAGGGVAAGVVPCAQKCTMSIRQDYNFKSLDLESQEIDAEQALERARINPLAGKDGERRLSGPSNNQEHHLQGFALDKNPSSAMNENLIFCANDQGAA